MSRSGSNRSIAPIRPSSPYETRSPSSTCAGSPLPSRPATYLTSGAYVRIRRSRTALSPVLRSSCHRLWVSSATEGEYALPPGFPHRGPGERRHPGGERCRRERNHPDARKRGGGGNTGERERDCGEEQHHRHGASVIRAEARLEWPRPEGE